jgi:adsorption protein B
LGRIGDLGDHWMRMRDRRATLAMPVLASPMRRCSCGASRWPRICCGGRPAALSPLLVGLLWVNIASVRLADRVRALFVWRGYGWREAAWSVPRVFVGNYIALLAARHALGLYLAMLAGAAPRWDKTHHQFPTMPRTLVA